MNKYFIIDCTKMILALLVVCIHSQPLFGSGLAISVSNSVFNLAVPLFFAFSGFFFSNKCYLKKALGHLMSIYLFYLIFSWPLCFHVYRGLDIIPAIQRTLFSGPFNTGWFIIALMWCMIITWCFNKIKNKIIGYSTLIFIAIILYLLCVSRFEYTDLQQTIIGDLCNLYKRLFYTVAWSFPQGLLFFVIGFLFGKYKLQPTISEGIIAVSIGLICYSLEIVFFQHLIFHQASINFTMPLATMGLLAFILSLCHPVPYVRQGITLRQASTMLYFSHSMIMFLLYRATGINGGWPRLILTLCIFALLFISYLRLRNKPKFGWLKYAA